MCCLCLQDWDVGEECGGGISKYISALEFHPIQMAQPSSKQTCHLQLLTKATLVMASCSINMYGKGIS